MTFEELTVVIVSRNRQKYLQRQIKFWTQMKCFVVALDGSENELNLNVFDDLKYLRYIHLNKSVEHRLSVATLHIFTKYVMLMGDDDIFVPSAVLKCMSVLDLDSTVIAVAGTVKGFNYNNFSIDLFDVDPDFFRNGQLEGASNWDRLRWRKLNYDCSTIYSVFRKDAWTNIVEIFEGQPELSGNLTEVIFEFCAAYSGKTRVIDDLYWLRSFENEPQWSSFEPVGKWLLKIDNKFRNMLFTKLQENIFKEKKFIVNKIHLIKFLFYLIDFQLEIESKRIGINKRFKWILLPALFIVANSSLKFKSLRNLTLSLSQVLVHHKDNKQKSNNLVPIEKFDPINADKKRLLPSFDYKFISKVLTEFYTK